MALSTAAARLRRVHLLHVDHGLRPDSHEDARHVVRFARDAGHPWSVVAVRVQRPQRGSIEAAARDVRYLALDRMAERLGLDAIATAHTLDDQAETVLLRLTRGTGVGGLAGIAPRRGRFVRPLLDVRRDELRSWLASTGVAFREDPTNADLDRERNWVRTVLLPLLAERRDGVALTLSRLAEHARADDEYLEAVACEMAKDLVADGGGLVVPTRLLDGPRAIVSRVVRIALRRIGARDHAAAVEAVLRLRQPVQIDAHTFARRVPDGVALSRVDAG